MAMIVNGFLINSMGFIAILISILAIFDMLSLRIPTNVLNAILALSFIAILSNTRPTLLSLSMYGLAGIVYLVKKITFRIAKNSWWKITAAFGIPVIIISLIVASEYFLLGQMQEAAFAWGAFGFNYMFVKHLLEHVGGADIILLVVFATTGPFGFAIYAAAVAFAHLFIRYTVYRQKIPGRPDPVDKIIIASPLITGTAIAYDIVVFTLSLAYPV